MHFPVAIHIGNSTIPLHGIIEFAAYFIGFRYFLYLRKRQSDTISSNNRTWILIGAIFGSIIGSRLVGGLENPLHMKMASNVLLYFYMNKTVLGGFLGGLWGVEITKILIGEKHSSGDLFTYPILLALMIGRIGCFSMGVYEETYGTPTHFFTGMDLGDGIMRHPVALYELFFLMLFWLVQVQLEKQFRFADGARFKIFMIVYLLFRFSLDFIKPHYSFSIGLSTIQITCIIGLIYYLILYCMRGKSLLIQIDHAKVRSEIVQ